MRLTVRLLLPRISAAVLAALLVVVAPAQAEPAAGQCEHDAATKTATYKWPTTYSSLAIPAAQRFGAGNEQISVGTAANTACGAATVNNTDLIRIIGTPPGGDEQSKDDFAIVMQNGLMAPGATAEADGSEIEIEFVNPGRRVRIRVTGSSLDDHYTAGVNGVNLNANETTKDLDVFATGTGASVFTQRVGCSTTTCIFGQDPGSGGNDVFSLQGDAVTGGPLNGNISASSSLTGGPGADTLRGTSDTGFNPGPGDDQVIGPTPLVTGFNAPNVSYHEATNPVNVNLMTNTATGADIGTDTIVNVPVVAGGSGADTITGNNEPNTLSGDLFGGVDGGDTINGMGGGDSLGGGEGDDTLYGGDGIDSLTGNEGNDTIFGEGDNDSAYGEIGSNDVGNDVIDMGPGNDNVTPARGNDIVVGGPGTDTISFSYLTAGVTFDLAITTPQLISPGQTDTVSGFENVSGSEFSDVIFGTEGANTLHGGFDVSFGVVPANIDRVEGRGGPDLVAIYSKQAGGVAEGGDGDDNVSATSSAGTTLRGGPGKDFVSGGDAADVLDGGTGPDSITAKGGDDTLIGGVDGEKDRLDCGPGNDTTVFDAGLDDLIACEGGDSTPPPSPPAPGGDPPAADPPATVAPQTAAGSTPAATLPTLPALPAATLQLPSAGKAKCVSRRNFVIRLQQVAGVTFTSAKVKLKAGKKTVQRTLTPKRSGGRWTVGVNLAGLPKGSFSVEITVSTADGRTLKGKRTYKTCVPKRRAKA